LVRLFYANLEVMQDDEHGLVLQSSLDGHIITVDPQVISQIIGVPVLQQSANPYNEVVLPPSLDDLKEFFQAVPQGEECDTSIRIGALIAPLCMLAKIVQHNLWPVVRRSDLILKRAQFVYAISLRLPFCLCKHILGVILEACDESNIDLPFGCLLAQILEALAALQSGMSTMQLTLSSLQEEVHSLNLRVEQSQLDIQECLRHHHLSSSDDEDDAPMDAS